MQLTTKLYTSCATIVSNVFIIGHFGNLGCQNKSENDMIGYIVVWCSISFTVECAAHFEWNSQIL